MNPGLLSRPRRGLAILACVSAITSLGEVPRSHAASGSCFDGVLQPASNEPSKITRTGSGREVDLRPKFRVGEDLRYVMLLENDGVTEMPPLESSKQTSRQRVEFRLRTIETDPQKGSTVELIYEAIRVTIQSGDTTIEYDSTKPAAGGRGRGKDRGRDADPLAPDQSADLAQALSPVVGTTLTLTVQPDGTISRVTGGGELSGALAGRFAGPIADPQGVKDLFGPIFTTRGPSGSARVGETWRHEDLIDLAMLGRLRLTTDHTLASVKGDTATIDFSGRMDLDSESAAMPRGIRLSDTVYKGVYRWDSASGSLESMEQTQGFTLTGDMEGNSVRIRSKGTVRVDRLRR